MLLLDRICELLPLRCPPSGAETRIIAFIADAPNVRAILAHLGEPTAPPRIAPARGPPISETPDARTVASTPMPSRHRSTSSINASLGNPDRRPSFARDARQARADGHQARSLTLAKHPMPGNYGVTATPDHLSFPSAHASQAVLRYSRRRFEALDLLSFVQDFFRYATHQEETPMKQKPFTRLVILTIAATASVSALADVRLTNDFVGGGYVSAYTIATGLAYTDSTINECSRARGRQNEPSVAINPRNIQVIIGSSNDYCGVYNDGEDADGAPIPSGPVWLGYYRSENGGASFRSSLVPGYPGDTSPYAALAQVRTSGSGDPVVAWDGHGRVFMGSESSGDPAGSRKTFGDVWVARFDNPNGESGNTLNDGKRFLGSTVVGKGSSAPNLLGVFHDKTAIEADRTGGRCDGNVYFAWARFTGGKISNIYFVRSVDHGETWSRPMNLTPRPGNLQDPDISVTGNGNVYVTYDVGERNNGQPDGVEIVKSTDCGDTFGPSTLVTTYIPYNAQDVSDSGDGARDCGDFDSHCQSGYTFFRRVTSTRSTADQHDAAHEWIYMVYDPTKPGTEVDTGTTYGSVSPGVGSQSAVYFLRYDGATGTHTTPKLIDDEARGHQVFADISADGGSLHALWWDSRVDSCYSPARPIGNCADRSTVASLDVFGVMSTNHGDTWSTPTRLNAVTSNPNYEQFSGRTVPFGGDYLWISSIGAFSFGAWTEYRNTVAGVDQRESASDDNDGADVLQCRTKLPSGAYTGDTCPRAGGLDQDIYGSNTP